MAITINSVTTIPPKQFSKSVVSKLFIPDNIKCKLPIKVGINGAGRIGRLLLRVLNANPEVFDVVAMNDLVPIKITAGLIDLDSVHGEYPTKVGFDEQFIRTNKPTRYYQQTNPAEIPWSDHHTDIVVEATGATFKQPGHRYNGKPITDILELHLENHPGVLAAIATAPPKDIGSVDKLYIPGVVPADELKGKQKISNTSCTTGSAAPPVQVAHNLFGVNKIILITIHASTNDQRVLDQAHTDAYRARASLNNIIATTTGAAKALLNVIPELAGRDIPLIGKSERISALDGSKSDIIMVTDKTFDPEKYLDELRRLSSDGERLDAVLQVEDREGYCTLDVVGNPHSAVVTSKELMPVDNHSAIVTSLYSNEWAYPNRVAQTIVDLVAANP